MFIPFHWLLIIVAALGLGGNLTYKTVAAYEHHQGFQKGYGEGVHHEAQANDERMADAKAKAQAEEDTKEAERKLAVSAAQAENLVLHGQWTVYADSLKKLLDDERAKKPKSVKATVCIPKHVARALNQ